MNILFKIDNDVVFYKPNLQIVDYATAIKNETSFGYNTDGIKMSSADVIYQLPIMHDRDCLNPLKANIDLASTIISIVRNDLIDLPIQDGVAVMSAMKDVLFMVQLGMFQSASTVLDSTPRTEILTDALLTKYSAMLRSSDAIV